MYKISTLKLNPQDLNVPDRNNELMQTASFPSLANGSIEKFRDDSSSKRPPSRKAQSNLKGSKRSTKPRAEFEVDTFSIDFFSYDRKLRKINLNV